MTHPGARESIAGTHSFILQCPIMTDPDLESIQRARGGDTEAFGSIVEKYQPILAAMLHRFAISHADLEDLVQETFIKGWKALPDWKPQMPFAHWLRRIAVRTGLEYCRKRKRSKVVTMEHLPEIPDAEVRQCPEEALDTARKLLATLPPDERALLTLIHLNGMSIEEAADHFGWSRTKTKVRAFRARNLLRKRLQRQGYE